jgi:cobalt-zinc-cadmium efflux system outer membrane protein
VPNPPTRALPPPLPAARSPRASRSAAPLRALLLALAAFAAGLVQAQAPPGLRYEEALELADAAPAVRLARQALARAQRQAAATAAPLDLTLSGGYDRRAGTLDPAGDEPAEDLSEGDVAPVSVTARIDPALVGPGADELARARDGVEAARDELAAARRQARIDVTQAFQEALRAETALALAREDAALAGDEAAAVRDRRAAGAASELDVADAELAVARAEQAAAAAQRERSLAVDALRTALGREVPAPTGPLPDPPSLPAAADADPAARPEVRAAGRDVDEADRSADAAIREALPVLTLDAAYQTGSSDDSLRLGASIDSARLAPSLTASYDPDDGLQGVPSGASSRAFEVGVRVEVPFSTGLPDALAAVRIAQEQARARRASTAAQASLAVERAFATARDAAERAELAFRAAELAAERARIARLRAEAGSGSDAAAARADLEARRATLDAERARDQHRLAVFRLYDALALPPGTLE